MPAFPSWKSLKERDRFKTLIQCADGMFTVSAPTSR